MFLSCPRAHSRSSGEGSVMVHAAVRVLRRVAGSLPTVLAWAGLAGLAVYGAANGWTFNGEKKEAAKDKKADAAPDAAREFTPRFAEQPFDVPVLVSHD